MRRVQCRLSGWFKGRENRRSGGDACCWLVSWAPCVSSIFHDDNLQLCSTMTFATVATSFHIVVSARSSSFGDDKFCSRAAGVGWTFLRG